MDIVVSHSNTPAFNLAAEEFLFSREQGDFVFLYRNRPSVIIGSNQAVLNEVDLDFCIDQGIRIIRRLSGGGAVYHDLGNFNYCFINGKSDAPMSPRFLDPVVKVLYSMGVPLEIRKRKDLWLEGKKVSGTASHLSRGRELHHGTLLYDSDLEKLMRALRSENRNLIAKATASVVSPVWNIRNYLDIKVGASPEADLFFQQLTQRMARYFSVEEVRTFDTDEAVAIEELQKEKYTRRNWNYRK